MNSASPQNRKKLSAEIPADWFEARAFAYDLLKCVFRAEPAEPFLALLVEDELLEAFPFKDADADIGRAVETMRGYLKRSDVPAKEMLQQLRLDYTRLFIGPAEVPAPPWESLYRDVEHLHFSQETREVRAAFRRYDFVPARFGRDPDDHIGLELDFMHKLCETVREKMESADKEGLLKILLDQQAFLQNHLLKWVPAWSRDVVKEAATDFYKGAALLIDGFLKVDFRLLDEAVILSTS